MNILVLTDFSSTAIHAANYAVDLFRETTVNFYLLNIQNLNLRGSLHPDILLGLKQVNLDQIQDQSINLQVHSAQPNHRFYTVISEENLVAATRRNVAERKIDLIVMGTSSIDYPNRSILGKHAREIIQKIKCNILVVSEKSEFKIPQKFVLPLDTSLYTENNILQFLKGNIFNRDSNITVMEIGMPLAKIRKNLTIKEKFGFSEDSHQCNFLEFKKASNLNENLLQEIQEDYNMIIILGKNLSICNKLLNSSNEDWATKNNLLPVLVLHESFKM